MRKQQSKQEKERGEETDGGRAECRESLIIYLEDTSSSTFSSGQWRTAKNKVLCRMLHSVGKLFHMI